MDNDLFPVEAVIISEEEKIAIYDIHTKTQIVNFQIPVDVKRRPKKINANCLHVINNSHFITAHGNELYIWSIYNRKSQQQKLYPPGDTNCLVVSPCCKYLVASIKEKIYIWQIQSGYLMSCVTAHYRNVSVIKFNREGTLLFTGSEDGSIIVWSFADLVARTNNIGPLNQKSADQSINVKGSRFTWQNHLDKVTGIEVTNGGLCFTCSIDKSLIIYNYNDGKKLKIVDFPCPIHSLVVDKNETTCYLGGEDGIIYQLALSTLSYVHNLDKLNQVPTDKPMLEGHKAKITSLKLNFDGTKLISGSSDNTCKFWDIPRRKLLDDFKLKNCPQDLVPIFIPKGLSLTTMIASEIPVIHAKPLMRGEYKFPTDSTISSQSFLEDSNTTIIRKKNITSQWEAQLPTDYEEDTSNNDIPVSDGKLEQPPHLIEDLRQKVEEIYNFKVEAILNRISTNN